MTASNFTWAGEKLTPKDLDDRLRTSPMPLVVKVTHVTSDYEKSCPYMANGTVLWVYGSDHQERVALKTTDNTKYISLPLEAPFKFQVVYTQDRGPPILLSSILRGKAQSDLRVEMAGNIGNRLSSTPDKADAVRYGTLQVLGIYKETVLQSQSIVSLSGGLDPIWRNISVNCPVTMDIATGLYGKSPDEFRKLKDRLKKDQSTKTTNQPDTSGEIVRLPDDCASIQNAPLMSHVHCLYACSEPNEANTKKTLAPPVKAKRPNGVVARTEVAEPEVAQPAAALKPSIADTTEESLTIEVLYEPLDSIWADSNSKLHGKSETSSPSLSKDNRPLNYENILDVRPPFPPKAYLNDEELMKMRSESTSKASEKKDSLEELPRHGSYVHGLSRFGKNKSSGSEGDTKTSVRRILIDPEEPQQTTELEEDDSEDGYEEIENLMPFRKTDVRLTEGQLSANHPTKENSSTDRPTKEMVTVSKELKPEDHQSQNEINMKRSFKEKLPLPKDDKVSSDFPSEEEYEQTDFSAAASTSTLSLQALKEVEEDNASASAAAADTVTPKVTSPKSSQVLKYITRFGKMVKSPFAPDRRVSQDTHTEESSSDTWSTVADIPQDIRSFSIDQVSLCLRLLNLGKFEQRFREKNVDGAFLGKVSRKMLVQHFQMDEFEAKQLEMFAKNQWRPR